MKTTHLGQHFHMPLAISAALGRLRRLPRDAVGTLHAVRRSPARREPAVEQIVDVVMATPCGESCEVRLDPRRTHIKNLEWLLPICVQQFGTMIDFQERPDGDAIILTIQVVSRRQPKRHTPALYEEVAAGALAATR